MISLKFQVTGFKQVSRMALDGAAKKGEPKNEGKSAEVDENKR
jgi:hypothetical protein